MLDAVLFRILTSGLKMIGSITFSRELKIVVVIVGLLILIPLLIHFQGRSRQLVRAIIDGRDEDARIILIGRPELLNQPERASGNVPLHWAVIKDRTNLVEWLLAKNADINAADPDGMTPLHFAAVFNRVACAEMLIAKGARMDAKARKYGALRLAPIHIAAEGGKDEMVKYLLKHGADANTPTEGANRIAPLHFAAAKGHVAVVETLIAAGADINMKDFAGKTPLAWAIENNQPETAAILRAAGAVP